MSKYFNNPRQHNAWFTRAQELRKAELHGSMVTFKNDLEWIYPMVAIAMHNYGIDRDTIEQILTDANTLTAEWGKSEDDETAAEMCKRITGIEFEVANG